MMTSDNLEKETVSTQPDSPNIMDPAQTSPTCQKGFHYSWTKFIQKLKSHPGDDRTKRQAKSSEKENGSETRRRSNSDCSRATKNIYRQPLSRVTRRPESCTCSCRALSRMQMSLNYDPRRMESRTLRSRSSSVPSMRRIRRTPSGKQTSFRDEVDVLYYDDEDVLASQPTSSSEKQRERNLSHK